MTLFTKGTSGNPSGRPLGSKHKLGEDFIAALAADFAMHGREVIARVRNEKPDQYLRIVASILPKDINITMDPFDGATDDELIAALRMLNTELARMGIVFEVEQETVN